MFLSEPIMFIKNARQIWGHAVCQVLRPCPGLTPEVIEKHTKQFTRKCPSLLKGVDVLQEKKNIDASTTAGELRKHVQVPNRGDK